MLGKFKEALKDFKTVSNSILAQCFLCSALGEPTVYLEVCAWPATASVDHSCLT